MPLGKTVQWAGKEGRQHFEGAKQIFTATLRDKTGYMAIPDKNKVCPKRNSSSVQAADRDLTWAERITQIPVLTNYQEKEKQRWHEKKHFKDNVLDSTHKLDQMREEQWRQWQSPKPLEACASDQNESSLGRHGTQVIGGGYGEVWSTDMEHNFRIKGHSRFS